MNKLSKKFLIEYKVTLLKKSKIINIINKNYSKKMKVYPP